MDTAVALVSAYLRFNGYMTAHEQPVLVGEGEPVQYRTATDIDVLAVRFPSSAVVVPHDAGSVKVADDLEVALDPALGVRPGCVDVLVAEVKEGKPRLNRTLRDPDVLYATLRRVDPGFANDRIERSVRQLIAEGEATCRTGGGERPWWRFRLLAFGTGAADPEGGPFEVVQLRHVAMFLLRCMSRHRKVWNDARFSDPVLDLLHLFDKLELVNPAPEA